MINDKDIQKPILVDEMKPLKDYLQGKTGAVEFVEQCKNISKTEDADFEVIEPKQLPKPNQ